MLFCGRLFSGKRSSESVNSHSQFFGGVFSLHFHKHLVYADAERALDVGNAWVTWQYYMLSELSNI